MPSNLPTEARDQATEPGVEDRQAGGIRAGTPRATLLEVRTRWRCSAHHRFLAANRSALAATSILFLRTAHSGPLLEGPTLSEAPPFRAEEAPVEEPALPEAPPLPGELPVPDELPLSGELPLSDGLPVSAELAASDELAASELAAAAELVAAAELLP